MASFRCNLVGDSCLEQQVVTFMMNSSDIPWEVLHSLSLSIVIRVYVLVTELQGVGQALFCLLIFLVLHGSCIFLSSFFHECLIVFLVLFVSQFLTVCGSSLQLCSFLFGSWRWFYAWPRFSPKTCGRGTQWTDLDYILSGFLWLPVASFEGETLFKWLTFLLSCSSLNLYSTVLVFSHTVYVFIK